ncbi:hypothetical protein Glove_74g265 [Diversispora epigaea]|uniref:Uncharacterized protein n=1 Tax=Diversispora epigaea TaxID=1348612 RepID=A0A397JIH1_9GLOM|nr:hypothetical protein Glove_74g265 [Diversispora epigaea]
MKHPQYGRAHQLMEFCRDTLCSAIIDTLKIEHNASQIDEEKLKQKFKSPWHPSIYSCISILNFRGLVKMKFEKLTVKENDMELFIFCRQFIPFLPDLKNDLNYSTPYTPKDGS